MSGGYVRVGRLADAQSQKKEQDVRAFNRSRGESLRQRRSLKQKGRGDKNVLELG